MLHPKTSSPVRRTHTAWDLQSVADRAHIVTNFLRNFWGKFHFREAQACGLVPDLGSEKRNLQKPDPRIRLQAKWESKFPQNHRFRLQQISKSYGKIPAVSPESTQRLSTANLPIIFREARNQMGYFPCKMAL